MPLVPIPHAPGVRRQMIERRRRAMEHLCEGGFVPLLPAGAVASSDTAFGLVIRRGRTPFAARPIVRSGVRVLPMRFLGADGRACRIASRPFTSPRQGPLIHEVAPAFGRPPRPVIDGPVPPGEWRAHADARRPLTDWLRARDLSLEP